MTIVSRTPAVDLAELVRTHQAGVWRYLRYLGCDDAAADDLTQETFLTVHQKGFDHRSPAQTAGFLRTVARNLYLMRWRREKRVHSLDALEPADFDAADQLFSTFARDDGGESYLDALRECLETLQGRARTAVERFYHDDRSRQEIATELAMSEDGVKSLLRRARELLRRCVEGKAGTPN